MKIDEMTVKELHPDIGSGGIVPWPAEKIATDLGPVSQPTIAMGPQGQLITHSSRVGAQAIILFNSLDGGKTWNKFSQVEVDFGPCPEFYSAPCGCGYLRDGTILVTYSHQFNSTQKYIDPFHDETHGLRTFVIRSTDHGKTWSQPVELDPSPFEGIGCDATRIHQAPDGKVFLPMGGHRFSRPGRPLTRVETEHDLDLLFTSDDAGATWKKLAYVGPNVCEVDILAIDHDVVLASARYQRRKMPYDPPDMITPYSIDPEHRRKTPDCENCKDPKRIGGHSAYKNTAILKSLDGGRTWSRPRLVTGWLQQTGCLVQMPDGAIVMPFSHKDDGQGQRFIVSYDQGDTWSKTIFDLNKGGMYASSVANADGTIVTVHDQAGRGNLQVLRWKLPPKSVVSQGGFFRPRPAEQP